MARAHARSWRATYTGIVPDALIDEVVAARGARIERWRTALESLDPSRGCFVAERDGRIVGLTFWGPVRGPESAPETGEVHAIYLDPDAIGRGIGRSLMAAAVDALIARRFTRAVLWVLESNTRARRFYEAAGWHSDAATKVDDRPTGSMHEVRYARALGPPVRSRGH